MVCFIESVTTNNNIAKIIAKTFIEAYKFEANKYVPTQIITVKGHVVIKLAKFKRVALPKLETKLFVNAYFVKLLIKPLQLSDIATLA